MSRVRSHPWGRPLVSSRFDGPLDLSNLAVVRQLRSVLERHGFTSGAVVDAPGSALPFNESHLCDDLGARPVRSTKIPA